MQFKMNGTIREFDIEHRGAFDEITIKLIVDKEFNNEFLRELAGRQLNSMITIDTKENTLYDYSKLY